MTIISDSHLFREQKVALLRVALIMIFSFVVTPGYTRVEVVQFEDPQKEALYKQMIAELRCLVCQNQNLADSNAELAVDLRRRTRELITQGFSRKQVTEYMVARYGEFVMYRPSLNRNTYALWFSPVILLGLCLLIIIRLNRRKIYTTKKFSASDHDRVRKLLNTEINAAASVRRIKTEAN